DGDGAHAALEAGTGAVTVARSPLTAFSGSIRDAVHERLRHSTHRRVLRLALAAAGLSAVYALGALLPFWFFKSPEAGAAFFPPAGITLAMLTRTSRRLWPMWLAVIVAS